MRERCVSTPPRVGKRWTTLESVQLLEASRGGEAIEGLARRHGRTVRSIQSRLRLMNVRHDRVAGAGGGSTRFGFTMEIEAVPHKVSGVIDRPSARDRSGPSYKRSPR